MEVSDARKIIDEAISQCWKRWGYRVTPCNFVDSARRTMCPMGAVQLVGRGTLFLNSEMVSFVDGFDGTPSYDRIPNKEFYELGTEYRRKYVYANSR